MSTVDQRPILVIATATGCGPCQQFKANVLPSLKSAMQGASNEFRFVHVNSPSVSVAALPSMDEQGQSVPVDIKRFVQWFPSCILITSKSWNSGKTLAGVVFPNKQTPMTTENIIKWARESSATFSDKSVKLKDVSEHIFEQNTKKKTLEASSFHNEESCLDPNNANNAYCSRIRFRPKNF